MPAPDRSESPAAQGHCGRHLTAHDPHGSCPGTPEAESASPDVFQKMRRVAALLDDVEDANRGELWTIERLRRVLAVIQDATVTYGIVNDDGSHTPMMVERDAIVEALYG